MTFGSLFAGIGGIDLGLERAGMECLWQVEKDAWCRKVLTKHWPDIPKYEDVCDVGYENLSSVDLVCGGFPCQDISAAGRDRNHKRGLEGDKSGLWFEYLRLIDELVPSWVLIENVPALLTTNNGADFAAIIQELVEYGYGVTWRVLDAQNFGVSTSRRRLFIVGELGEGSPETLLPDADEELQALSGEKTPRYNKPRICGWGGGLSLERLGQCVLTKADPLRDREGNGLSRRMDTRRWNALGNAVVPQCAEYIGRLIMEQACLTS